MRAVSCARERTPSRANTLETWCSTVCSLMWRRSGDPAVRRAERDQLRDLALALRQRAQPVVAARRRGVARGVALRGAHRGVERARAAASPPASSASARCGSHPSAAKCRSASRARRDARVGSGSLRERVEQQPVRAHHARAAVRAREQVAHPRDVGGVAVARGRDRERPAAVQVRQRVERAPHAPCAPIARSPRDACSSANAAATEPMRWISPEP